jgi:hypothetical protein
VLKLWFALVVRRPPQPAEAPRLRERTRVLVSSRYREFYRGRRVMITGGLGFIGSNIAHRLVELGANVLLMDSLIPDAGANFFNIDGIADKVTVNIADVRQESTMNHLVRDREVIFNLAGQVSHIDSMKDPYTDPRHSTAAASCRSSRRAGSSTARVKVVFAGTRQVYGKPDSLPVTEGHLVRPIDVNGINKAAGENYHLLYNNVFKVRACSLRLTNVYGRGSSSAQPPGLHRLVHPPGARRTRDSDLRRRLADARLRLRRRRGGRVPARGRVGRLQRPGVQRRRLGAHLAQGLVALLIDVAGAGSVATCHGRREEGDRHRQLLRRLARFRTPSGWEPACRCATGFAERSRTTRLRARYLDDPRHASTVA